MLTLAELIAAYQDPELGQKFDLLIIDNDNTNVYSNATGDVVYEAHPADLLTQLLDHVGIPWGNA